MVESHPSGPVWRKAAASGSGACVEVAFVDESVLVRDSKDRCGPALSFSRAEWTAFVSGVRSGDFDPITRPARRGRP